MNGSTHDLWRDIGTDAVSLPDTKSSPRAVPLGEVDRAHI